MAAASIQNDVAPVERSKEVAADNYSKMAKWYDLLTASSERKFTEVGLRQFGATRGETVLEVGFGTGFALEQLAKGVGPYGTVHGIDIAQGMVDVATARLEKANLESRVQLRCGDAANLDFLADKSVDGVFMSFVLELFDTPEIPHVLLEAQRVLRPGGRLTVVALAKKPEARSVKVYEWFHKKMPVTVDCRPIHLLASLQETPGLTVIRGGEQAMWGLPVHVITAVTPTSAVLDAPKSMAEEGSWTPPPMREVWVSDEAATQCEGCERTFNVFRRRHHCRLCGAVICGKCSAQTLAMGAPEDSPKPGRPVSTLEASPQAESSPTSTTQNRDAARNVAAPAARNGWLGESFRACNRCVSYVKPKCDDID